MDDGRDDDDDRIGMPAEAETEYEEYAVTASGRPRNEDDFSAVSLGDQSGAADAAVGVDRRRAEPVFPVLTANDAADRLRRMFSDEGEVDADDAIHEHVEALYYMQLIVGVNSPGNPTPYADAIRDADLYRHNPLCACRGCERPSSLTLADEREVCCALCAATDGEHHDLMCQLRLLLEAERCGTLTSELSARVRRDSAWSVRNPDLYWSKDLADYARDIGM